MRWCPGERKPAGGSPAALIHGPAWLRSTRPRPALLLLAMASWTPAQGLPFSSVPFSSVPFSSVTQLCPTLCDPMDCSAPGLPVHHQLLEFTHIHVH